MKLSFLHKLSSLVGAPTGQVVGREPAAAALRHLLAELPELLLATVLDTARGEVLASVAPAQGYPPSAIAGPALAVVRQVQAGLAAQGAPSTEQLCEVVLTLGTQLHLLRLGAGGQQLLYLAVETRDTNLAIARQLAAEAADHLVDAI